MSTSATILTFHPFSPEDPKKMIRQISELFQVNTYLVFESYVDLDGFADSLENYPVQNESDNKSYVIDKYIENPSLRNITVYYNDYLYKWMFDRANENIPPVNEFKKTWSDDPGEIKEICNSFTDSPVYYEAYLNEENWFEISTGCAELSNLLYTDYWRLFYNIIMERNYDFRDIFLKSRKSLIHLAKQLGNDCLYYIQEHSHCGLGQGGYWGMSKEEIQKVLNKKNTKKRTVNLARVLLEREYWRDLSYECQDDANYFTVFYDDLSPVDIKKVKSIAR